jgi:CRISPR/Cas system-associated exonuclease Cas4 (RecB family)
MLMTLNDLQATPQETQNQCVQVAMTLSDLWDKYKAQHDGNHQLVVDFHGERGRSAGVHASELSGCLRKVTYSVMGVERKVRAEDRNVLQQRVFDMGTIVHAYVQSEFHRMCEWLNQGGKQLTFEDEAPIHPGLGGVAAQYNMHSSCDGIFTFWSNGQPFMRVGLEIKTMADSQFSGLSRPKDDHMEQTCFYMRALDVPLMWTLYFAKNNQLVTRSEPPFLFKYNGALWEQLERRINSVMSYAQNGQLPAKQEGKPCSWCPFAHTCLPSYLQGGRGYSPPASKEF